MKAVLLSRPSITGRLLRVAWDDSLARRNLTGTGVYASQLSRHIRDLGEVDLHVLNGWDPSRRKAGEYGSQGLMARAFRTTSGLAWSQGQLPLRLWRGRFDVVHSPSFLIPFFCPCASVVTVHDITHLVFPQDFDRRWRNYLKAVLPVVLRRSSAVIAVSENTRQDLLRSYGVPENKVHVVHHGVEHARYYPGQKLSREWAEKVGLTGDYILHLGVLCHRKNVPLLLRAVASLVRDGKFRGLKLVLAGPDLSVLAGAGEIRNVLREMKLEDTVLMVGHVPDDVIPGLYANARLLALPSLYEGFGLPVLEAMASGVPVIASNTSSIPEVAGDAARLVNPRDQDAWSSAIAEVLEGPRLAEELRGKGLARARGFTWEKAAAQTLQVYRSVVT